MSRRPSGADRAREPEARTQISSSGAAGLARDTLVRTMCRIRAFEQTLLRLFSEGKLFGTTHTCVGQEACAAALYPHLDLERDAVFTNHRCHGHFLAKGGSMRALMAEIMGRKGGICLGRGGSQHLCDGAFYSQGVQGGSAPLAAGYARWLKSRGKGGIAVVHIGDGTLGEGVIYETMNLVGLWSLPMLVVLEHNGVAQSTDTKRTTAGDIEARFSAFGLAVDRRSANDPVALAEHFERIVPLVREGRPFVQILDTFRLMAHSKGDDDRDPELLGAAWKADWLECARVAGDPSVTAAWIAAELEAQELAQQLEAEPWETLERASAYRAPQAPLFTSSAELVHPASDGAPAKRINEALNQALHDALAADPDLLVLGEDLADPYGGAFKVSRGLSTRFPDRVLSTPISEAAFTGFGTGHALAGGRAVVEIMFGDFVTLAVDQIVNQAAKMHFMYGERVSLPVTIRLASGGYRGYGPTHSQSLERMFCGVPGLEVVALSRRHRAEALLGAAIADPNPVLFVENKLLYSLRPLAGAPPGFRFVPASPVASGHYPSLHYTTVDPGERAGVTVVTYGGMTDLVEEALEELILEEELDADYFVLTQLSPLHVDDVIASVRQTGRLVTVEEGVQPYGIGAEVIARAVAGLGGCAVKTARVGALDLPIPNSRVQEREVLPSKERVIHAVRSLFD